MDQKEFYIRSGAEDSPRGPYRLDQLVSLGEAKQIDRETLYYDAKQEDWVAIGDQEELVQKVFPEKKRLSLARDRQELREQERAREMEEAEEDGVDVDEMLAAAEGRTEETKHLRHKERTENLAALLITPLLGVIMLFSGGALLYPFIPDIQAAIADQEWMGLVNPILIIGLIDLLLALLLFLSMTDIFGLLRARAMLGAGFFGYVFWVAGSPELVGAVVAISLAAFVCTLTLRLGVVLLALVAGLLGGAYLAFASFSGFLGQLFG
ncbi:MAG: hypothetical protein ACOCVG_02395 [Verrucomicrobiota bacterium]